MTDVNQAKMGVAVLIDHEACLIFLGLRCDICYRVCPVFDRAINLELLLDTRTGRHAMVLPTVHSEACTGCGKCESACVMVEQAAIRVLPLALAKGALGRHYCVAWDEKIRAGGSWNGQQIDLPDRLPPGMELRRTTLIPALQQARRRVGRTRSKGHGRRSHSPSPWRRRHCRQGLSAHKWWLLRRFSQVGVLRLFLLGPLAGVWIVNGI